MTDQLSLDSMSQMRLGALMARDIPHTGMACQIDVSGAIHYRNKAVSGQRLALHALKNTSSAFSIIPPFPGASYPKETRQNRFSPPGSRL